MNSKRPFQIFFLMTLLFSPFGANQPALASTGSVLQGNVLQNEPRVSLVVNPPSINIGETALVTVRLDNVPAEGYTSLELTCTYDPNLVEASNIVIGNLFGIDPVTTINGPHNGRFIVAIAGSHGNIATNSGTVIAFNVRGLQAGQSLIECQARVSKGDKALVELPSIGSRLTVLGSTPTSTTTAAIRITIDPGQTTAVRLGVINPNESIRYLLNAAQGQVLSIKLTAPANEVAFGVNGPTGLVLKPLDASPAWITSITTGGDHTITLVELTGSSSKSYVLEVSLTPPAPTATPTVKPITCDKAEFIADVTVPPGTVISPGAHFTKTWRLMNVGTCTWTTSYRLAFLSGEQMGAPSSAQFPQSVSPGETVDIALNMTAPSTNGDYRGYWIFQNSTGGLFGVGPLGNEPWFVDIVVSDATVTPSTTSTPIVSPSPTGTLSQTPGIPSGTPSPSLTPDSNGPTITPVPNVIYDFAVNMCQAVWSSGAGQLPCPGIDGNPNGFVFKLNNPKLENGVVDTRPGLLTFPQNVQNGYIQGFYPPFHVQSGDRFRSSLACEFGATNCYVAFRLDYQVGSDPIKTFFGPFLERYEGLYFTADIDLSSLAGKDVRFILTVLSAGNATEDRALWVGPIIYRTIAGSTPTSESPTATSTESPVTSTPVEGTMPTSTPDMATGTITGRVLAGKPVTIDLFTEDNSVVTSIAANTDGTFSLTAPAGTYNIVAHANGFLSAMGSITVAGGGASAKPVITLLAGDIDSNFRIDQLDAMTIGMNYNRTFPLEADLNNDAIINVLDLELLARNYRKAGPVPWE